MGPFGPTREVIVEGLLPGDKAIVGVGYSFARDFPRFDIRLVVPLLSMMHIFQVAAKVTTLGESFLTEIASKWSITGVLPKVIPQVTRLLENAAATWEKAFEMELDSLGLWIALPNGFMPSLWDVLERFLILLLDSLVFSFFACSGGFLAPGFLSSIFVNWNVLFCRLLNRFGF